MKIRMLKTAPGSIDGIHVDVYEADREYTLAHPAGAVDLAQAFVGARLAVEVREEPPAVSVAPVVELPAAEEPPEVADDDKAALAPETQAMPESPENKGRGGRRRG